jgi:hypothetical protein
MAKPIKATHTVTSKRVRQVVPPEAKKRFNMKLVCYVKMIVIKLKLLKLGVCPSP